MKRIVWLSDIHLNFVVGREYDAFVDKVAATAPDAILLGGDIGEAPSVGRYLADLDARWSCPIHFVLGNHDFYFGSIAGVRSEVALLCSQRPRLNYLTLGGPVQLAEEVALVGHDGWGDGRVGDYERSLVMMRDYQLVAELSGYSKQARWPLLKQLGDEAAEHARRVLPAALAKNRRVIFLTHVPPLRAACWHEGQLSDDHWAPHFVCQALGDALLEIMQRHPEQELTVLCGHTHGAGECRPLPNVHILTGGSIYGEPAITGILEV